MRGFINFEAVIVFSTAFSYALCRRVMSTKSVKVDIRIREFAWTATAPARLIFCPLQQNCTKSGGCCKNCSGGKMN